MAIVKKARGKPKGKHADPYSNPEPSAAELDGVRFRVRSLAFEKEHRNVAAAALRPVWIWKRKHKDKAASRASAEATDAAAEGEGEEEEAEGDDDGGDEPSKAEGGDGDGAANWDAKYGYWREGEELHGQWCRSRGRCGSARG